MFPMLLMNVIYSYVDDMPCEVNQIHYYDIQFPY